jgi:transposase
MARPLSLDLRVRVAAALAEGSTVREAAKRFGVSVAALHADRVHRRRNRPT